jgi:capsular polysaccharide biosynthesis protein
MADAYPDVTLRDYIRVIFRQKLIILVTILSVCLTLYVGLVFRTPVYEAQVKMLISAKKLVDSPYFRDTLAGYRQTELSRTQSEIVKSSPVLENTVRALALNERPLDYELGFAAPLKRPLIVRQADALEEKLGAMSPAQRRAFRFRKAVKDLGASISVEPLRDTDLFLIRVREFSPVGAAITANTLSRAYVIFDLEQQLAEIQQKYGDKHQSVRQVKDNISRMVESLSGKPLPDIEAIGPASVKVVEQASLAFEPIGQPKRLLFALGVSGSVFLGIILAFLFDYLDQTIKTPQDAKRFFNMGVIGSIPKKRWWNRAVVRPSKRKLGAYPKAITSLADQLYLLMKERGLKSVLLASTVRSEGATTAMASLAPNCGPVSASTKKRRPHNSRNPFPYCHP